MHDILGKIKFLIAKKRTLEAINRVPPASVTKPIKQFNEMRKELTDRQKEVLDLYYIEEIGTLKEVANELNITHSLARTENSRIRKKFDEFRKKDE